MRQRGMKIGGETADHPYIDAAYDRYGMDVGAGETSPHQHARRHQLSPSPLMYYRDRDREGFNTVRNVSFVQATEFALSASPGIQGIAVGDVNNDGNVELVVGCIDGTLSIFRHTASRPWLVTAKLGTILCVQVVRCARDTTRIAVLNAEGYGRLFAVANVAQPQPPPPSAAAGGHAHTGGGAGSAGVGGGDPAAAGAATGALPAVAAPPATETLVEVGAFRRVPRNVSNMVFFNPVPPSVAARAPDPNAPPGGWDTHIVLGGLDRMVYLYRVVPAGAAAAGTAPANKGGDAAAAGGSTSASAALGGGGGPVSHDFELLAMYQVEYAVTSLAVQKREEDTQVLVGLSNSSYVVLYVWADRDGNVIDFTGGIRRWTIEEDSHMIATCEPTDGGRGFERVYMTCAGEESAVVRQDGCVTWCPQGSPPVHLGEMVLPNPSFMRLGRGHLLCLCTWGGDVFFIDSDANALRFSLHVPARAFWQGRYSVTPGATSQCIFCATFDGQITMLSDVAEELVSVQEGRLADSPTALLGLPAALSEGEGTAGSSGPPLPDTLEQHSPPTPYLSDSQAPPPDPRLTRGWAKRIRSLLHDVTPDDVALLERYKAMLEARLGPAGDV